MSEINKYNSPIVINVISDWSNFEKEEKSLPPFGSKRSLIKDSWCNYINEDSLEEEYGIGCFDRISIPVRRAYPQLIANKIVDVQPLKNAASIFYLKYRYVQ